MAEEAKKVEPEAPPAVAEKDVSEEKTVVAPPPAEDKADDDCKALAIVESNFPPHLCPFVI